MKRVFKFVGIVFAVMLVIMVAVIVKISSMGNAETQEFEVNKHMIRVCQTIPWSGILFLLYGHIW